MENKVKYDVTDLTSLEKLEPVRVRPGMYIGSTGTKGLHHCIWEILDNSIDEISNGYGNKASVILNRDKSVTIIDNGRGVPTGVHPIKKKTGVEMVYTELRTGGKFDNKNYKTSGGLHGVGAAVVNALLVPFNSMQAPYVKNVLNSGSSAMSVMSIAILIGMTCSTILAPKIKEKIGAKR